MQCYIYRSSKRSELYLYLPVAIDFEGNWQEQESLSRIPKELINSFGHLSQVMSLDLATKTKLARVPIELVRDHLQTKGYFVQMPPDGLISPTAVEPEGLRGA